MKSLPLSPSKFSKPFLSSVYLSLSKVLIEKYKPYPPASYYPLNPP